MVGLSVHFVIGLSVLSFCQMTDDCILHILFKFGQLHYIIIPLYVCTTGSYTTGTIFEELNLSPDIMMAFGGERYLTVMGNYRLGGLQVNSLYVCIVSSCMVCSVDVNFIRMFASFAILTELVSFLLVLIVAGIVRGE